MRAFNTRLQAVAKRAGLLARNKMAREVFANNFLKEFSYSHRLLKSLGHPKIYQLETTNSCPYRCNMCPRTHSMTREQGHMDIGLFRAILDQVNPAWQVDDLTGEPSIALWHFGEPVVYRHFAESISYCHSRGLRVVLSTNPSAWSKQRIDEIIEVGVDEMYVMFDGMDDDTSMAIRGHVASFQRGSANFMELLEKKCRLGVDRPRIIASMVKQQRNAHQWKMFQDHWKRVAGVDDAILCDLSTFGGDVPALVSISDTLIAQDPAQVKAVDRFNRLSKLPCYYPWDSLTIAWDGRVVPCCRDHNVSAILGDLNTDTLEAVWNGPPMQELRRQFVADHVSAAPCATCRERSAELRMPGFYYPLSSINLKRLAARVTGSRFP